MAEEHDAREVGERIARLLDELRAQANPYAWQQVDELLRTVLDLYGRGLARVVEIASGAASAEELRAKLAPGPLVQLNGRKKAHGSGTWTSIDLGKMGPGEMRALQVAGQRLVVCSISGALYAYRDTCAACGSRIDAGGLEGQHLTCPSCGQRYDLRLAGRASDGSPLQLDPLPLLADATGVRIALPEGAA